MGLPTDGVTRPAWSMPQTRAAQEAEYAFWYSAAFSREYAVREKYPRSITCNCTAVQERPWFTIGIDRPIADKTCIAEK
jgi:hypothetical protein